MLPATRDGYFVSIHAPARGATNGGRVLPSSDNVSIHAPARGATTQPRHYSHTTASFNPRAREGRDLLDNNDRPDLGVFQSTRPRGARPLRRVGKFQCYLVSIHAPARGATALS